MLECLEDCLRGSCRSRTADAEPALLVDFWYDRDDPLLFGPAVDITFGGRSPIDVFFRATAGEDAPSSELGRLPVGVDLAGALERLVDLWDDAYGDVRAVDTAATALALANQWTYLVSPQGVASEPEWNVQMAGFTADCDVLRSYVARHTSTGLLTVSPFEHCIAGRDVGLLLTAGTTFCEGLPSLPLLTTIIDDGDADESTRVYLNGLLRDGATPGTASLDAASVVQALVQVSRSIVGQDAHVGISAPPRLFEGAEPSEWLSSILHTLSLRATALMGELLPGSPSLILRVRPQEEWLLAPMVHWTAQFGNERQCVPLDHLSGTQQKWARYAVHQALARRRPGMALLDEPETGLHRSAELAMARGLIKQARLGGQNYVIATHSPEFLHLENVSDALILKTAPAASALTPGRTVLALEESDRRDLDDWGLRPSDLLTTTRAILLVEGEHDAAILAGFAGTRLAAMGVIVLPLRGASKLPHSLDSQVLFRFTDAPLWAILDGLAAPDLQAAWEAAVRVCRLEGVEAAVASLGRSLGNLGSPEARWMMDWLSAALVRQQWHRVVPWGFAAADIIDYLPAERFVSYASNWADLRQRAERERGGPLNGTQFKSWLCSKGADLRVEHLRQVATELPVPEDVELLLQALAGPAVSEPL